LLLNLESKQDKAIQVLPAVPQTISVRQTATVSRVVDGDTIKVMIQGKEDTVRLIGMDAPETVNPEKTTQCFGKESSDKAREILIGKSIILESDSTQGDKDEYGRLLRYIFLLDGTDFDEFMISEGYAYEYTFKNSPYKYRHEFIQAQKKAKKERKGLWGSC
jgi:micrococcal nuclease